MTYRKRHFTARSSFLPSLRFWSRVPKSRQLPNRVPILAEIDLKQLQEAGIHGIILDLDNTVVSEDDLYLSPGAEAWIEQAQQLQFRFFMLSNGKRHYRVRAWAERLQIDAINPARKPLLPAFRKACRFMQLRPQQIIVIGDSWHTDVLGAWLLGSSCIQVASLPHPPRWWEKIMGRWVQYPYPKHYKRLPFDSSIYLQQEKH